jgi:hypothetical protein
MLVHKIPDQEIIPQIAVIFETIVKSISPSCHVHDQKILTVAKDFSSLSMLAGSHERQQGECSTNKYTCPRQTVFAYLS